MRRRNISTAPPPLSPSSLDPLSHLKLIKTMTLAAAEGEVPAQYYASSKSIGSSRHGAAAKVTAVMDLLDEFWFFRSALITGRNMLRKPPALFHVSSADPENKHDNREEEDTGVLASSSFLHREDDLSATKGASSTPELELADSKHKAVRKPPILRRMPTLPAAAPRQQGQDRAAALSFNSSYPKLRHSMSALDGYQSSSSSKNASTDLSTAGDLPPRHMTKLEKSDRYNAIRHYIAREAYYRKTFKEKKWRSLNDLEYIEIQGLKDLGFVLDRASQMNANFLGTTPDIQINSETNGQQVTRSCLYKSCLVQSSAPPMFRCVDRESADDMKDQLRFWAKAVASSARLQQC